MVAITISPPSGGDIQAVAEEASKGEDILPEDSGVQKYQTTIGGGGSSTEVLRSLVTGGSRNSATIIAILQASADLGATGSDLRARLADPSVAGNYRITVQDSFAANNQFQVTLSAADPQPLADAGTRVLAIVQHEDHIANPTSDASSVAPTGFLPAEPAKASRYGLTTAQVGQQVRA